MNPATRSDLANRLNAVVEEAQGRIKSFQTEAESSRQEVRKRFQDFLPIADQIAADLKGKLELLRNRLKFEVVPSQLQTERFYSRSITIDVKTELASVVKLAFKLTHDSDVKHILLDYSLDIIPVFFKFNPHKRLDMLLEAYDENSVSKWLDDCLVEFANAYLELHSTKQYQERILVSDPVAGISFPKYFAATSLEHQGSTLYFISEESKRDFMKQHGIPV